MCMCIEPINGWWVFLYLIFLLILECQPCKQIFGLAIKKLVESVSLTVCSFVITLSNERIKTLFL